MQGGCLGIWLLYKLTEEEEIKLWSIIKLIQEDEPIFTAKLEIPKFNSWSERMQLKGILGKLPEQ